MKTLILLELLSLAIPVQLGGASQPLTRLGLPTKVGTPHGLLIDIEAPQRIFILAHALELSVTCHGIAGLCADLLPTPRRCTLLRPHITAGILE